MDSKINISLKVKLIIGIVMIIGLVLAFLGFNNDKSGASVLWSNILLNGYFYLAIAGGGAFFVTVHTISDSGWHTGLNRIPEAMGIFLPIGGLMILLVIPGIPSIYHWSHPGDDALLIGKSGWLNTPFFIIRMIIYISIWALLFMQIRKVSLLMDENDDLKNYSKMKTYSAIFTVVFVLTFYFASWDWLMSTDPHWYSTLYGFYIISGMLAATFAMIILILALMKLMGYFGHVNEEQIHDLGKYLFAISMFWGYLWGSQFLLIWYSNIPEESVYFVERLAHYKALFGVSASINFILPLLLLMTRGSKRNLIWLSLIAFFVLAGQWSNFYLSIVPGTSEHIVHIGLFEIGLALVYLCIFIFAVFHSLTKGKQVARNHPFLQESFEYENII